MRLNSTGMVRPGLLLLLAAACASAPEAARSTPTPLAPRPVDALLAGALVDTFLAAALEELHFENFLLAEALAQRALELEPTNDLAKRIVTVSRQAQHHIGAGVLRWIREWIRDLRASRDARAVMERISRRHATPDDGAAGRHRSSVGVVVAPESRAGPGPPAQRAGARKPQCG